MIDRSAARAIAARYVSGGLDIDDAGVRELPKGWLFPYRCTDGPVVGSQGTIVNKNTGAVFHIGSAFPIDRDIALYEHGYQYDRYDLVITSVRDTERSLDVLGQLGISVVTPEYEHGTVWRVPRMLTRAELGRCLKALPQVFGHLALYTTAENLERARQAGVFGFRLLMCGCGCQRGLTSRLSGPA
jgi:hypothetical protein